MKKQQLKQINSDVKIIVPTKAENKKIRGLWGNQEPKLGDISSLSYELDFNVKSIFALVTKDPYVYNENIPCFLQYRCHVWEDLITYDFICYDKNSFKFIYFEDDPSGNLEYSVVHVKKEYINKLIEEFYKRYDGDDKSLNKIVYTVFDNVFEHRYYGLAFINDWLKSIGIKNYLYHFYFLENAIDL